MTNQHVVLVTGASTGIGAHTALELSRRGHKVALAARTRAPLDDLATRINNDSGEALAIKLDITDLQATRATCAKIAGKLGPITALINNAGTIGPIARLADADPQEFAACVATNLTGAWNACAAVLPGMLAQGGGVFINLSSGASVKPMEGWSAYCSSKAALSMITRMLNFEYGAQGIVAYGFRPGLVATQMQGDIRASGINPISQLPESDLQPPEHAARAIAWLMEAQPARWRDEEEADIRDPDFIQQAGL